MARHLLQTIRRVPFEAVVWTAALVALSMTDPTKESAVNLCFFKWIGLPWCPGCGLGHAIAYALDGNVAQSFATHPFGPIAPFILGGRALRLTLEAFRRTSSSTIQWPSYV